jgi:hypothetical protein
MVGIRALGAALGVALAAGVLAGSAPAAPVRPASDHTLTSAEGHFMVHYYTCVTPASDQPCPDYATQTEAGDIAALAERAYTLYTSWGLTPPVSDGDEIDIYLKDLPDDTTLPSLEAYAQPDNNVGPAPAPSSGMIWLSTPTVMQNSFTKVSGLSLPQEEEKAVANELFVLFAFAKWVPRNPGDYWLIDSLAEWAAFTDLGYPSGAAVTNLGPPDIALDCRDDLSPLPPPAPALPFRMCDPDRYTELGYTRWAFWQTLENRFGSTFPSLISSVLANGAALDSGPMVPVATTALSNAIAANGSSLANVFSGYTNDLMDGSFGVPALAAIRPPAYTAATVGTASLTAPLTAPITIAKIPVNHFSARYVTFERGDGDGSHACFASTLGIKVTWLPASGVAPQPYFYWDVSGSRPQPLSVSGNSATLTVPWDTCDWGTVRGWLSLPNPSPTVDAADFTVQITSHAVDLNTPATAAVAPSPTSVWGTTVPVPTSDVAPSVDVFGPELLKLSAAAPAIQLIVGSSGPGMLNATLGATVLGSRPLRAGNNDLRFVVPKAMLTSLRRSASAASLLTLTPMSPSGTAGTAVTRRVVVTALPKPKPARHKRKKKK